MQTPGMKIRAKLAVTAALLWAACAVNVERGHAQDASAATFKAGVDVVRISAVVRDHKGRFVRDLAARDFEILDAGLTRRISAFRSDLAGVGGALLFGVVGGM